MELKNAQEELDDLRRLYKRLRSSKELLQRHLPELVELSTTSTEEELNNDEEMPTVSAADSEEMKDLNAKETLAALESIRTRLHTLEPKIIKFRKRANEKDPVTEKPRYGEKTMARVQTILTFHEDLCKNVAIAFGEETASTSGESHDNGLAPGNSAPIVHEIRKDAMAEEERERQKQEEERLRQEQEEAARREEEERLLAEQRRVEEEERLRQEQERAELARLAEESRLAILREQEQVERADREWVASIPTGPDGVREQLEILVESTKDDKAAQSCAVNALHTIFSQIVSRPEEPKFRRIRRDHPKFNQDIGRHPGGKELLIAAGFRLGAIDEVPSYISVEPNIEKDMDGWAAWFDLLKATLEIIETQLIKSA